MIPKASNLCKLFSKSAWWCVGLAFGLFMVGVLWGLGWWASKPHEIAHLSFPSGSPDSLLVNGGQVRKVLWAEGILHIPYSFSALSPNTVSVGDVTHTVHVDKIKPGDFISIEMGGKTIKLDLFPRLFAQYQIKKKKSAAPGYLLFSLFEGHCRFPSFGVIMHTNGNLLYYRDNETPKRCVSDFKKTKLPSGEVVFSLMEQEKPMPPFNYWYGSLLILDEKFNLINKVKLLPTRKHPTLDVENHESLILDKNHFILSSYYHTEQMVPGEEYPSRVVGVIIQEIKDGNVIFEWDSTDYPQLYSTCLNNCNYQDVSYQDYLHFNSLAIDPKDNHFVLSFGSSSSIIKIHRQTGAILWTLGGLQDDYALTPKQRFAGQHSVSFLPSGELMLFDNHSSALTKISNTRYPTERLDHFSRILIFQLDEQKRRVKRFKQIELPYLANTMGSVYLTENNTFIVGYGSSRSMLAQEFNQKGKLLLSLKLLNPMYSSYRVRKYSSLD